MNPKTLRQLLDWSPPLRLSVVANGIAPEGAVVFLYGVYGTLKTWLSMDFAYQISVGGIWLVYQTVRHRVLVLQSELTEAEYRHRWVLYTQGRTVNSNGLYIVTDAEIKLDTPMGFQMLENAVIANKIEVVVVDNLISVMIGDGTKNVDAQRFIDNCKRLRARTTPPVTFLIVHHAHQPVLDLRTGKTFHQRGYEMFGSSFFADWADTILEVRHEVDGAFPDSVRVTPEKYRLAEASLPPYTYQFQRQQAQFRLVI